MALSNFEKEMEKLQREGIISRAQFLQIMAAAGAFVALGTNKAYAAKSNAKGNAQCWFDKSSHCFVVLVFRFARSL